MDEIKKTAPYWERPAFQRAKRGFALVICALFLAWRASEYLHFYSKTVWALETALYGVLVWNYVTRLPAVDPARGVRDLAAPYLIAALPFAVFFLPPTARIDSAAFIGGQILIGVGTAVTVAAMATLRRSFSISVEARAPVTTGLYRFVRHPVYLGEIVSVLGVMWIRLAPLPIGLTVLFVALQCLRARWEEEKLARVFPEYAEWRERTPMLVPFLRLR
jgi:protein-S-isoprenylcysteine O-methyltransferase Ste14